MSFYLWIFVIFLTPAGAWAVTESHGLLGLENTTYFGRLGDNAETGSYSQLSLDYRGRARTRAWGEAQADVGAMMFLEGYDPLLNPRELFVASPEIHEWVGAKVSVGRKLETWSEIDRTWHLGVWQPRFRWDYLHPEEQGLTGLFAQVSETDSYRFVVFATPIFIPDQNANVQVENGQIVSQSPWSPKPRMSVPFGGRDTPVAYSISRPEVSEIVQNPGGALMLELGNRKQGPWFRAATAYKPVNQLLLGTASNIAPREPASNQPVSNINVEVTPSVAYHHVYETSVGYESPRAGGWISILQDRPIMKEQPNTVLAQRYSPVFIVSPGARIQLNSTDPDSPQLEVSWLRRWGGDAPDQGLLADPDNSQFEPRFLFSNAVSLAIEVPLLYSALGVLRYRGEAVYEAAGQGLLVSSDFTYQTRKSWAVHVGADLLGEVGDSADAGRGSLLTRYRDNSRIRGGVSYVF